MALAGSNDGVHFSRQAIALHMDLSEAQPSEYHALCAYKRSHGTPTIIIRPYSRP